MFSGRLAAQAARSAAQRAPIAPRAAVRAYAQASSAASSKPPVAFYGVDGTYASALYTAAAKSNALDSTSKALESLNNIFKKDPKLAKILTAPTLSVDDKKQIIAELQKQIGPGGGEVVKNFLNTLAENNRLGVLAPVAEKFMALMSAHKGEVELTVTSAAPLDNRVLKQLETAISKSKYVGQGDRLKVVPKVNPDIRGGLIVEVSGRTIDLSVAAKMSRMSKLLRDQL